MIHYYRYSFFLFIAVLIFVLTRCSTQRNNLVNRNLHQLSTKYNVVFNGEEALNQEIENIEKNYHDNFFKLLPVEQFNGEYEIMLSSQQKSTANLERAEEKAVKAIQKHSMEIRGVQENNQIDNAYLLLGKSRYYQKRFLAALDAFNYELDNDFKSDRRNEFKLWREKTNIRMDNYEQAIRNLEFLGRKKDVKQWIRSEAYAYAGQAQINIDSLSKAITDLQKAAELAKDREKRARYLFITAQLLEKIKRRDSAIGFLKKIEEKKRPRKYSLQAELYRYHLSLHHKEKHADMLDALYKKLKQYEYHKFYPYINYEIGEIYHNEDSLSLAVEYYTKAARSQDKILKEKSYEQMGRIGFQKKDYLMAGTYLDSLLRIMSKETLKYLKTKHKRANIEDVIILEKLIKRNDSIMKLVNADSLIKVKMIEDYIVKLQEKEEKEAVKQISKFGEIKPKYANFYFYNNELVVNGKSNFKNIWGKISLTDMWRLKNKTSIEEELIDTTDEISEATAEEQNTEKNNLPDKYKVSYYYKQIPSDPKEIDSIENIINYAHYQVGMIYYEKFKELEKAKENLEIMLAGNPKLELIPSAKYNLYKIYKDMGEKLLAEHLAQEILAQYPESIYADLIKNPNKISDRSNKEFQEVYEKLYNLYKGKKYADLLEQSKPLLIKYSFHPELAKIELLRATAIARSEGLLAYEKALKNIILKYPKSSYEQEAIKRMKLVKKYKDKVYSMAKTNSYKLLIPYDIFNRSADNFIACINNVLVENKSTHLHVSKDPFTRKQSFVVVHNFLSEESASYLIDLLKKTPCAPQNYFVISSENYKILQLTKKWQEYKDFINKQIDNYVRRKKEK